MREGFRRARTKLAGYCVATGLNRLGTGTYFGEACHHPRQVPWDVADFFRALRALSYVWPPEWHHTNHGLHWHFAVGQYIPRSKIREAWGCGYVSRSVASCWRTCRSDRWRWMRSGWRLSQAQAHYVHT